MSTRRRPTRDSSWQDLRDAILGFGGITSIVKFLISFVPDTFPQKPILVEMVPWISGLTGAGIIVAWNRIHHRAAKNDALEALIETEELLTKLTLDPNVGSADRQKVREMLSNLKVYRSVASVDEARAYGEALAEEVKQLLGSRRP